MRPNIACTRQMGFAPLKGVYSVLKHFPSNQFRLVPPTCGQRKPLGRPTRLSCSGSPRTDDLYNIAPANELGEIASR